MVRWETPRICKRSARSTARSCAIWVSFPVGRPLRTAPIAWVVGAGVTEAWCAICLLLCAKCRYEATAPRRRTSRLRYALRVWPLSIRAVKNSSARFAALGAGANSATGDMGGAGIRPVVIVPALFQAWVYQSHAEPGEVLHIARDHGKVMLQGSSGDHSIRRVERTPG